MTSWDMGAAETDEHGYGEEARRRARRRFLAVIGAVVVMAGFAFALWWAYAAGTKKSGAPGEIPFIRADGKATKMRPEQPGGFTPPNQDKLVFNPGRAQGQAERLLPPPEAPMPRPVAPPPAAPPRVEEGPTAAPSADAAPAAPVAAPVAEPPAAPAPPPAVAAVAPPPQASPAPPPAAAPAAKPVAAGAMRLQLGALRSEVAAKHEWERLKGKNGDLLAKLGASFPRTDLPNKGTYWRIQVGPISDGSRAERICGELKKRNVPCILIRS